MAKMGAIALDEAFVQHYPLLTRLVLFFADFLPTLIYIFAIKQQIRYRKT
ncbi:MAG: hypothetical protein SAL07_14065 [Oscillatoria sp. PMC 1051.18]|nr:hypothetical protein [Oscillatoria sp. PMC 1050.18]MEC5031018.1 hypothetical protein [Oscillatoria sp. PMC 1051.18]